MTLERAIHASFMAAGRYNGFTKQVNEGAASRFLELREREEEGYYFGVKDTPSIDLSLLELFKKSHNFIWHTIDRASERGRAIDIELTNPLTAGKMSGSSSGTALNVLYGINDLGIGTDGGGSVLYPSLALNLYSTILSGIQESAGRSKVSTDGIPFTPSTGLIAQSWDVLLKGIDLLPFEKREVLPDRLFIDPSQWEGYDSMREMLEPLPLVEISFPKEKRREPLISFLEERLSPGTIFAAIEKGIDENEYGDSLINLHSLKSRGGASGKQWGKVINMVKGTALTIPLFNTGTGLLLFAGSGRENFNRLLTVGKLVNGEYRSQLFHNYFLNSLAHIEEGIMFL